MPSATTQQQSLSVSATAQQTTRSASTSPATLSPPSPKMHSTNSSLLLQPLSPRPSQSDAAAATEADLDSTADLDEDGYDEDDDASPNANNGQQSPSNIDFDIDSLVDQIAAMNYRNHREEDGSISSSIADGDDDDDTSYDFSESSSIGSQQGTGAAAAGSALQRQQQQQHGGSASTPTNAAAAGAASQQLSRPVVHVSHAGFGNNGPRAKKKSSWSLGALYKIFGSSDGSKAGGPDSAFNDEIKRVMSLNREMQKKLIKESIEKKHFKEERSKREDFLSESQRFFREHVLSLDSRTAQMILKTNKRVRKMWRMGLPPQVRGQIWQLAIGNELKISRDLYTILRTKRKELQQHYERSRSGSQDEPEDNGVNRESSIAGLMVDLSRTFPSLQFFREGGPFFEPWVEVLECYVLFRPDVGYVQGMSFLVAMLLLYMEPFEAFVALANMLNDNHFYAFFRMNADEINKHVELIKLLLRACLPQLYDHLIKQSNINCQMFVIDWFLTLFSKSLPLEIACRIWDMYFCDGDIVLYRTTLGVLKFFRRRLLNGGFEECMSFLSHINRYHDLFVEDEVFRCIESIKLTPELLHKAKHSVGLAEIPVFLLLCATGNRMLRYYGGSKAPQEAGQTQRVLHPMLHLYEETLQRQVLVIERNLFCCYKGRKAHVDEDDNGFWSESHCVGIKHCPLHNWVLLEIEYQDQIETVISLCSFWTDLLMRRHHGFMTG